MEGDLATTHQEGSKLMACSEESAPFSPSGGGEAGWGGMMGSIGYLTHPLVIIS